MRLPAVGEGSAFAVTVEVYDELDQPVTMATVEVRIDCLTNKKTIRDWSSVTPAESMEVIVLPEENAILADRNKQELRQMTTRVNDDLLTQLIDPDPVTWYVKNVLPGRDIVP